MKQIVKNSVIVVGGGIAGTRAALDLADAGIRVYLVEKSPSIGGRMAKLDKTFPTNDCSLCILSPFLVEAGRHPLIELMPNSEIMDVKGRAGDFQVNVKRYPTYINWDKCVGCGSCNDKCPVRVPNEFDMNMSMRKAAYLLYPQAVPLKYTIDSKNCLYFRTGKCRLCEKICDADAIEFDQKEQDLALNVGSIILAIGANEFDPSLKKEYGYSIYPNVVSSIEFERMMSASGPSRGTIMRPSDRSIPKKIAFIQCVGSRDEKTNAYCSSVCCMNAIKQAVITKEHIAGVESHIFFMDIRAFGKEFDDYYVRAEEEYGIKFTRCRVPSIEDTPDNNLVLKYLEDEEGKEEKFGLVVLSVGLIPPKNSFELAEKFGIDLNKFNFCSTKTFSPIETSKPGIYVCGTFSSPKDIPETVTQASGAAAKALSIVRSERNKLTKMKKYPPEIDVRDQEPRIGVFVCHCGVNIGGVVDVPQVTEYVKGLPNVVYAEDNLYTCSQDTQEEIKEKIKEQKLNRVVVAACTPRTHEPLFQETIREAGLNPYLFEFVNLRDQCSWVHMHEPEEATKKAKDLVRTGVTKARLLEPLGKVEIEVIPSALVIGGGISGITASLELAKMGFDVHLVEREGKLGGNLNKLHYLLSGEDPKKQLDESIKEVEESELIHIYKNVEITNIEGYIGNFKTTLIDKLGNQMEISHGTIIIATGGEEYKPKEYLYERDNHVITQLELEEALAKGDFKAKNIVMIQCVGSRDDERSYCSRVCCQEAIKNALKIKEVNEKSNIFILYRDIRTYGFNEEYYKKAREDGIIFVRYEKDEKPVVSVEEGKLRVSLVDPILKERLIIEPDLLVLSSAILPHKENEELAKMLKVPLSKDGFFLEAHVKLRPVEFATDGIFLCGLAHSPRSIDESISQACAAAAKAAIPMAKGKAEAEPIIASVDEDKCTGCGTCVKICPYGALRKDEKGTVRVTEVLCKGCGTCGASCPERAITMRHFTDEQLIAQATAALKEVIA